MHFNRKSITILLASFLVLAFAGGLFYYFKYHKTGADTLAKRNTSCVIKVVDADTSKPITNASVTFLVFPNVISIYSSKDGCAALPDNILATNGDFYQVRVSHLGYTTAPEEYLTITSSIINGKSSQTIKLNKSSSSKMESLNDEKDVSQNTSSNSLLNVEKANAEDSSISNQPLQLNLHVTGSIDGRAILGAEVKLTTWLEDPITKNWSWVQLALCTTVENLDDTGFCSLTAPGLTYNEIKKNESKYHVEVSKPNYKTSNFLANLNYFDILRNEDGTIWSLTRNVVLDQILKEDEVDVFTGKSLANECQGSTSILVTWNGPIGSFDKKLWDKPSIQNIVNNLATALCVLKQGDPMPPSQVFKIQILDIPYSKEHRGFASVNGGSAAIVGINSKWCGSRQNNPSELEKCRNDNKDYFFNMPVHEYGHIIDLFGSGGRFSQDANFLNLYKLINYSDDPSDNYKESLFNQCKGYNSSWSTSALSANQNCYFATNPREFWATSFNLWIGQSLGNDLKLSGPILSMYSIIFSLDKNSPSLADKAYNALNFWKKHVSTSLGTYCHPSLMDENGVKQGLSTYPVVEPKPSFTKGGPLASGVVYTPDQILAGTPLAGSSLTINYKKLPANYVASTMTDENFSVVPYSTGINQLNLLAKFPATKGLWPDTLTSDANRCGIYERGMLAQSDKTADIKAADVKRGPYPLYSLRNYELRGYYRCNKTEPYKVADIRAKADLNTSTKDVVVDVDLSKYISCPKTTTPTAPGMPK